VHRVLLDTNQLVSSLLSSQGPQGQLLDAWRRRAFLLCLAPRQLEEVSEVLRRPKIARKYAISSPDRQVFVALLHTDGLLLPDAPPAGVCRDPDDDDLLGCAAAGGVDYLVTSDADLLILGPYRDVRIVDARAFLAILSA
jgi:hypothetical protein